MALETPEGEKKEKRDHSPQSLTKIKPIKFNPLKFLLFFGPIFAVSDLVGGFHFSTKKSMRI
jgi:hypothetical protein